MPGAGAQRVELRGEVSDWRNGILLERQDDGSFGATLDCPVGLYQYKLLVDGRWSLDASNPRTRSADGNRNNVLVVDGGWMAGGGGPSR
jgi:hypothetical protein